MHWERDHKTPIRTGAQWGTAATADALGWGPVKRCRALPERNAIVLKFGWGTLWHDANHWQPALGKLGSLAAQLTTQIDRKAATNGRPNRSQIGSAANVMGISPALKVGSRISQLAQQISLDHTRVMPQIASHIVAKPGADLNLGHGRNEIQNRQTTGAGCHSIPVHACVIASLGIASPGTGQCTSWGATRPSCGANRHGASLIVAAL